jgi:hypothetical protein
MTIEMSGINDEKKRKENHLPLVAIPFLDALSVCWFRKERK